MDMIAEYGSIRKGMTVYVQHYLDIETGEVVYDSVEINQVTRQIVIRHNESVSASPERYIKIPHISYANIRKEYFEKNNYRFPATDVTRYQIPGDAKFGIYQPSEENERKDEFMYIAKIHNLLEDSGLEEDFLQYADEREDEIVRRWCRECGITLTDELQSL